MSQWGRVERPETDTHTNGQLIYDRCGPAHRRGEDGITKIGAGKLFSNGKNETEPYLTPHTKTNSIQRSKRETHNYKLSEENRAKNSHDFGTWRDFLSITKAQTVRERMINPIRAK